MRNEKRVVAGALLLGLFLTAGCQGGLDNQEADGTIPEGAVPAAPDMRPGEEAAETDTAGPAGTPTGTETETDTPARPGQITPR